MDSELSKEQIEKYVAEGGTNCPYCGSDNISSDPLQGDGGFVWCPVECKDCEGTWDENYELKSIDEGVR